MVRPAAIACLAVAGCGTCLAQDSRLELTGHTKYRLTSTSLPEDSLLRDLTGSSATDLGFDGRLNVDWRRRGWSIDAAGQFAVLYGDTIEFTRDFGEGFQILFPRLPTDERRLFDLTHVITDENKQASVVRLDRLSAGYTADKGVIEFGRQAITWGNGLMFNTVMDLFNPFDPAAVDKEFKSGDDMLYGQYLRDNGDDLQAVAVFRRNPISGDVESDQGSVAVKYHGFLGAGEYDALLARHYGETLLGFGGNRGIGGALWRGDIVATITEDDGTVFSAVTSLSQSFTWLGKNVSGIVEYYYNGFGQSGGQYGPEDLATNPDLVLRLARGELFNLGRHYIGLSAMIEITPLFLLTPNVFLNVEDPSALIQFATSNDVGTNKLIWGALNIPVGASGTEFGGIDSGVPGKPLSTGPGIFVQFAWYF